MIIYVKGYFRNRILEKIFNQSIWHLYHIVIYIIWRKCRMYFSISGLQENTDWMELRLQIVLHRCGSL